MAGWYRVTKTIKGHQYLYEQQTYREGGRVRTRNRYMGPASGGRASKSAKAAKPSVTTTSILGVLGSFGKAVLTQFDVGRWGAVVSSQLGLTKAKRVTTTKKHRWHRKLIGQHKGKRYFAISKDGKYKAKKPPPDEVWIILEIVPRGVV
jgi:hypothetical protein